MPKISKQVIDLINALHPEIRTKVANMVREHLRACLKFGAEPGDLERVYIEAIEVVEAEMKNPERELFTPSEIVSSRYEIRNFGQYVTPIEARTRSKS